MASDDASTAASTELDSIAVSALREGELNVKIMKSGKKAVLVRRGSDVKVYGELCPHMGADLSEGWLCAKTGNLQCRWHGYVFSTDDGRFLENPNEKFMKLLRKPSEHYKPEKAPRLRLPMVPFYIQDGRVFLGRSSPPAATAASSESTPRETDEQSTGGDRT